ncbi:MAG: hypothetical protein HRT37_18350 [Alteromonadaceae bacterium]|nr:hypothetical protein [Alteromonadaceae bacterium]
MKEIISKDMKEILSKEQDQGYGLIFIRLSNKPADYKTPSTNRRPLKSFIK